MARTNKQFVDGIPLNNVSCRAMYKIEGTIIVASDYVSYRVSLTKNGKIVRVTRDDSNGESITSINLEGKRWIYDRWQGKWREFIERKIKISLKQFRRLGVTRHQILASKGVAKTASKKFILIDNAFDGMLADMGVY